ncbi:MAG: hypothetical protein WKG01_26765 [Kofleriaceae bacterium]
MSLEVSGEASQTYDRTILSYADEGERPIEIRAQIPTTFWYFTFVREDTLVPDLGHLVTPPLTAPAEIGAIRP